MPFQSKRKQKRKYWKKSTKTDPAQYQVIRFFTNQPISQKEKEDIYKDFPDRKLVFYDKENLVTYVSEHEELGNDIDFPVVINEIMIDYLKKHNQLKSTTDIISTYIPWTIRVWNEKENKELAMPFADYCSNLPQFTLLQASAGISTDFSLYPRYFFTND